MNNSEIGKRIQAFRSLASEGKSISSKELAEKLEISHDILRNIESGRTALPLQLLLKLHNMGLDMHFLLSGEGSFFSDTEKGKELSKISVENNLEYPGQKLRAAAGKIK